MNDGTYFFLFASYTKHLTVSMLVDTQGELLANWIHTRDTRSETPQTQTLIAQIASTQFKGALLT